MPLPNDDVTTTYLGMTIVRTHNVRTGAVIIDNGRLYVHPTDPPTTWQPAARANLSRIIRRNPPVSIKQTCRLCGRAYPARQGLVEPDRYCSDRCRERARDYIDCHACGTTGAGRNEGDKCGECFGTTYQPCGACQEGHAQVSFAMLNPTNGVVYHVCPACVPDEVEAGACLAPQKSV